jgi:hypothetical protein
VTRGRRSLLCALVAPAALLSVAGCGAAERATEPTPTAPAPGITGPAAGGVPHLGGGTIVLPPAVTGLPGGPGTTFAPGARPAVTELDVANAVICTGATPKTVTASYKTENADRVAIVLDGRQVPGAAAPISGTFDVSIPCDDRTHVLLVTAVSPDNQTAVDSRAIQSRAS